MSVARHRSGGQTIDPRTDRPVAVTALSIVYAFSLGTIFGTNSSVTNGHPHFGMMPACSAVGSLALLVLGQLAAGLALLLLRPTAGAH